MRRGAGQGRFCVLTVMLININNDNNNSNNNDDVKLRLYSTFHTENAAQSALHLENFKNKNR